MQLILIDTMIAAGILSRVSSNPEDKAKSKAWWDCTRDMTNHISDSRIVIPPPVYYELTARNEVFHKALSNLSYWKGVSPIFQYIDISIRPDILLAASLYKLYCRKYAGVDGINWVDTILAAYCLIFNHCIITVNQKDFPDIYFEALKLVNGPMFDHKSHRQTVYLLKPRIGVWNRHKN